jgi:hypothetical protein
MAIIDSDERLVDIHPLPCLICLFSGTIMSETRFTFTTGRCTLQFEKNLGIGMDQRLEEGDQSFEKCDIS